MIISLITDTRWTTTWKQTESLNVTYGNESVENLVSSGKIRDGDNYQGQSDNSGGYLKEVIEYWIENVASFDGWIILDKWTR